MDRAIAFDLARKTATKWNEHNAPSLGASLAYYTLLSLAPLVVLVVAFCGFFLNQSTVEQDLISQSRGLAGDAAADMLRAVINSSSHSKSGIIASSLAIVTLLFGASGVFAELQQSMNLIWDAPARAGGVRSFVIQRLATFLMVIMLGCLILFSLLISTAVAVSEQYFVAGVSEALNQIVTLVALAVLFGLIFKFVPDVRVEWREVGIGAFVTSFLFTVGRALLAFYLSTAGVGSTYGAAGSVIALVVWVYYSAQIFFFGAIFTRVYAEWRRTTPKSIAATAIN